MEDSPLEAGALIADRYRVQVELGAGGMARIYRALDVHLERPVALKVMRIAAAAHAARFEREARAAASLRHPSVVAVHDYGVLDDGRPYLVLEYIEGRTLHAILAADGPFLPAAALDLLRPIVGALASAHEAGIIHRDIKPENLMVQNAAGLVPLTRLLDFGIAAVDPMSSEARLTRTGAVFGTPAYMSPEQALGKSVTPASDVWGIGATLQALLTGKPPFDAESPPEILVAVLKSPPAALPAHVSADVRALVAACLEKEPNARPKDARALLDRWPTGSPPAPLPRPLLVAGERTQVLGPGPPVPRWLPPVVAGVLGLAIGLAIGRPEAPRDSPSPASADAGAPADSAPPDAPPADPLADVERLLESGQAKAALAWLEAHDEGPPPRRLQLRGLARLEAGEVEAGVADVGAALQGDPDLAQDQRLTQALIDRLDHKDADAAVLLLGGPLAPSAVVKLREIAENGLYRPRWRAVTALELADPADNYPRYTALIRDLRVGECELRRKAARELGKLGKPEAIPELRRAGARSFFENSCMDGDIERAIRALQR